jgi:hypothetical protein
VRFRGILIRSARHVVIDMQVVRWRIHPKKLAKVISALRLYGGPFVLGMLIGCSGGPSQQDPSWILVPISDVHMVAGEWEGTVKIERAIIPEGSVRLMIHDNGTYLFAGQTISDVAIGAGSFEIRDGRLIGDTTRRTLTLTLYSHKGTSVLFLEATKRETGDRYRGVFTKAQ